MNWYDAAGLCCCVLRVSKIIGAILVTMLHVATSNGPKNIVLLLISKCGWSKIISGSK